MSAGIETSIWLAIKGRIETLSLALPKVYPADTYAPAPGVEFLAVSKISAQPERITIAGGKNLRAGSLLLTAVQTLGQDFAVYEQTGALIAAHFAEDTQMRYGATCVWVPSRPHVLDGFRDGGWWRTPVNVRWESFA